MLQLLAGWNILVQIGVALGINLDKAERARKIGNEFIGSVRTSPSRSGSDGLRRRPRLGWEPPMRRRPRRDLSPEGRGRKCGRGQHHDKSRVVHSPHRRRPAENDADRGTLPRLEGPEERWLFVSPHDDDIVLGAGLTFQVGLAEGVAVHALVVTDGCMGYCRPELRDGIAKVRAEETRNSFRILGLPADRLWHLDYPDGGLAACRGRRFVSVDGPGTFAGAVGLQDAFTRCLRQTRPNRVFLATSEDIHPDHRIVHEEMLVCLYHAQGAIWPELGEPIAEMPAVYEYAVYCDFPEPPQIRIETPDAMLQTKLAGIRAYASQEQIETVVKIQREVGAIEYLRELKFHFYRPQQYHPLFARER